jgi:hypothetical protein
LGSNGDQPLLDGGKIRMNVDHEYSYRISGFNKDGWKGVVKSNS